MTDHNHISADIKHLAKPIDSVFLDQDNTRKHSSKNIKAIAESLKLFGQQTPIKVTMAGKVLKGNGTLEAAKLLEWKSIAVSVFDAGQEHEDGYAVQDNKTGELADWDFQQLADKIPEIDKQYDLAALGWERHEVEQYIGDEWSPPATEPLPDRMHKPKPIAMTQEQYDIFMQATEAVMARQGVDEIKPGVVVGLIVGEYLANAS